MSERWAKTHGSNRVQCAVEGTHLDLAQGECSFGCAAKHTASALTSSPHTVHIRAAYSRFHRIPDPAYAISSHGYSGVSLHILSYSLRTCEYSSAYSRVFSHIRDVLTCVFSRILAYLLRIGSRILAYLPRILLRILAYLPRIYRIFLRTRCVFSRTRRVSMRVYLRTDTVISVLAAEAVTGAFPGLSGDIVEKSMVKHRIIPTWVGRGLKFINKWFPQHRANQARN